MSDDTARSFLLFTSVYVFCTSVLVAILTLCGSNNKACSVERVDLLLEPEDSRPLESSLPENVTGINEGIELNIANQAGDRRDASRDDQSTPTDPILVDELASAILTRIEGDVGPDSNSPVVDFPPDFNLQVRNQTQSQGTHSAATTSRIRHPFQPSPLHSFTFRAAVADLALGRAHNQHNDRSRKRPSMRQFRSQLRGGSTRRAHEELQSSSPSEGAVSSALRHRPRALSWSESRRTPPLTVRSLASGAASNVLQEEAIEGESQFYRYRYVQQSQRQRIRQQSFSSSRSGPSVLPNLPIEAVCPDDAADAFDPGRTNPINFRSSEEQPMYDAFASCSGLCELIEPDFEMQRLFRLALPTSAVFIADPCLRIVLISIISYFVDTESMIGFVLVNEILQLSSDVISSVIMDVETNLIQDSVDAGGTGMNAAIGSHVQLALLMQIFILLPVLLMWVFVMEYFIDWLCVSTAPDIVVVARGYTRIIVADFLVRACSRTFMVPYCLDTHPTFDRLVDVIGTLLTVTAIIVVVRMNHAVFGVSSLAAVGIVQVIASVTKMVVKVACVIFNGMMAPYQGGLRTWPPDVKGFGNFVVSGFPLFIGSLFELKEWQLLTLMTRALGPAAVAAWAVLNCIWEFFEALAAAFGEAGGTRLEEHLFENRPRDALTASRKVMVLAYMETFLVGSLFIIVGPNLSVLLTNDATLQTLLDRLLPMTVLASFSMTLAQVLWSLVGATGRYIAASIPIIFSRWLLIFPVASGCVFGYSFGLESVAGSIAIGYATAAVYLARTIATSDWAGMAVDAMAPSRAEEDRSHQRSGYGEQNANDLLNVESESSEVESPIF